jgi:DisA bacterial checkpoint controller nucleotide-binding
LRRASVPEDRVLQGLSAILAAMSRPAAHAYPPDLAAHLEERWQALPPGCPLPSLALLEQILSTAFQASLLRDEERPVTLRLLLTEPEALPVEGGPPFGLLRLAFDQPRSFTVDELRRLSPAARYHRSLVGLGVTPDGQLTIWGIVQSGPRWLQTTQGGRAAPAPLPDMLVVRVTGPGRLFVARGSETIAGLYGGRLTDGELDVFESRWLASRFAGVRAELTAIHRAAERTAPHPWGEVDPDLSRMLAQQMLKRLITTIRAEHHGGMVLVLPPECAEELACGQHVRMKYACDDAEPRRRYRTLLLAVMRVLATGSAFSPDAAIAGWSAYRGWNSPELSALDEAIVEMANLIGALAGVDGAVVLSKRFEVMGFGGEITGDLPEVATVQRALDLEATEREAEVVDVMGTRHRAAYRLCARFHEAVAIVISQDGGVRFVAWQDDAVTYWDHASLGSEEA